MNVFPAEDDELLPIIDDHGDVIGREKRSVIHRKGLMHLSVHAMIFNGSGELLIQKRSERKDSWPGYWDLSVGGHMAPGETPEQSLARETEEEIGICVECRRVRVLEPSELTGWEKAFEYIGQTDETPQPNPAEISDWLFILPEILVIEINEGERAVTPVLTNMLDFYIHHLKEH